MQDDDGYNLISSMWAIDAKLAERFTQPFVFELLLPSGFMEGSDVNAHSSGIMLDLMKEALGSANAAFNDFYSAYNLHLKRRESNEDDFDLRSRLSTELPFPNFQSGQTREGFDLAVKSGTRKSSEEFWRQNVVYGRPTIRKT